MLQDALPALFDRIPLALFAPLSGTYAPLYWAILARFYHFEFEREPLYLVKETALFLAEEALAESPLWHERRQELLEFDAELESTGQASAPKDEAELRRQTARRLIQRLERAGWLHFEYRSAVGQVLNFYPYAARVLETLMRVARDEQPLFQGYAHSIAALLRKESIAARPGVALREAKRHTLDLMRELKILERNIYAFTQRLLDEVDSAQAVLEEGLERYRSAVMANYHRLKTVDNLYKWRSDILVRLDALEQDTLATESAASWYSEQDGKDRAESRESVRQDLRLLRAEFDALPRLVGEIDLRNARFSGVALRKLMYLLRHDKRMEGQLQLIVDRLAHDLAPELELDVYGCELLCGNFLYTAPTRHPRPQRQPLLRKPKRDPTELMGTLTPRLRRAFARTRLNAFVHELLGARHHASTAELPLSGDDDYVRAIYLVAYGLDGGSAYRFERISAQTDKVRQGRYGIPAGTVTRRRK